MTQTAKRNAGHLKSRSNEGVNQLKPSAPSLLERIAAIIGVYLAAAGFILVAFPQTHHCLIHLTGALGAGIVPVIIFLIWRSTKLLAIVALGLVVILAWMI